MGNPRPQWPQLGANLPCLRLLGPAHLSDVAARSLAGEADRSGLKSLWASDQYNADNPSAQPWVVVRIQRNVREALSTPPDAW